MRFFYLKSIRTKIIINLMISCLLFGLVFIFYVANIKEEEFKNKTILNATDTVSVVKSDIISQVESLRSDLEIISNSPLFDNLTTDLAQDKIKHPKKYYNLQRVFLTFLKNRKYYSQIRLVGKENHGKEIIRVDKDLKKNIKITPKHQLQEKENEPYFKEIIKFKEKKVYYSPLSFNREFGIITKPKTLMLRAALPVFSVNKENKGFLIINLDFSSVINKSVSLLKNSENLIISDPNQNIVYSGKNKFEFFGVSQEGYFKDYQRRTSIPANRFIKLVTSLANYLPENKNRFLQISMYYNHQIWSKKVRAQVLDSLKVVLIISVILIIFAFLFGTNITSPIKKVTRIANRIKENRKIDFSQLISPQKDEIGILIESFYKMSQDLLSVNHRLHSQREALDSVAIVAETNSKGVITYVNSKFIELSQFQENELLNKTHRIVNSKYHPKSFFQDLWNTINAGEIWRGEIKNKAKDGSFYWVHTTIYPERNERGEIEKFISIRFDITDQKNKEEALEQQVKDEVERRIGQDRLLVQQSKMAEMGNMISAITHQWKQPLNAIMMSCQLIEEECEKKPIDTSTLIGIQNTIEDQVDFLNQTVNDFSEYLRPSREPKNFNVYNSLQKVISIFKPQLDLNSIEVEVNKKEVNAFGFDNELKQVIFNIINNARDNFNEKKIEERKIKIVIEEEEDSVSIFISDNGGGIPQDLLPERIFEPYISTKGDKGTGIGLAIAKRIIEISMNGDIIASNNDEGASFKIVLPKAKVSHEKLDYSILFAEDEEIAREAISIFLGKKFQTVVTVKNGLEGMEEVNKNSFDLVITDINMPIKNGNQLAAYLREKGENIPIIALTSVKGDISQPEHFIDIIDKPIRKSELFSVLKKNLPSAAKNQKRES